MVNKWNDKDIQILIETYPYYGQKYCSNLLNRSKESIYSKVKELNINRIKNHSIKWTKNKIDFIIENYSKIGSVECSKYINISPIEILRKANYLGIKLNDDIRNEINVVNGLKRRSNKVNYKEFLKFDKPEVIYILGLIWGDGYVRKENNLISINMIEKDILNLIPIFNEVGDWNISNPYKKYHNAKRVNNQITINTYNAIIVDKLIDCDYHLKSINSAIKILKLVNKNFWNYFFRGFFDADGCLSISNDKYLTPRIRFSGNYEHDWSYFNELNLDFKTYRYMLNKGRYSQLSINKKNMVIKFLEFIYSGKVFGLKRKYEIYEEKVRNNIFN